MNAPRRQPGDGEAEALGALRRAGRHGLNTQQVANVLRVSRIRANAVLLQLVRAGAAERQYVPGGRALAHWWISGQGPKIEVATSAPRTRSQPPKRVSLAPDAPATNPNHVQPTICPSGEDMRFRFAPPSRRWLGQISRDWLARRRQESEHHGA